DPSCRDANRSEAPAGYDHVHACEGREGESTAVTMRRRGFTLVELLVALVLTAVLGGAAVRLFLTQSRFFDLHVKQQSARSVSRSAVNGVLSDLRMAEAPNAVTAASTSSITVR